jgi:hypothetical protein
MALLEIPVSGCTCFKTKRQLAREPKDGTKSEMRWRTLVNVRAVCLLSRLLALLLLSISRGSRLTFAGSFLRALRLGGRLRSGGCGGFASGGCGLRNGSDIRTRVN